MRRAVARGRILPQSLSTDPRMGRVSLKAALLFPLMWINCDDQGRISGDPDEVKYATCPNIDGISKADIPELLKELETQELIKLYSTSKIKAIQMLDWWEEQRLQWAYPSRYPAPQGWQDRLRYHRTPKEIVTENWVTPGQPTSNSDPTALPSKLPCKLPSELPSKQHSAPLTTPFENKKEKEGGKRRGRGNLPSALGSRPPPSPTGLATDNLEILHRLTSCFKKEWGRVPAERPHEIIPREPNARESAQLRDLAKEISSAGGCPLEYIDQAFREAAGQTKFHISYVRAVLLDWLGIERNRSP